MSRNIKIRNKDGQVTRKKHIYSSGPFCYFSKGEDDSIFTVASELAKTKNEKKWMDYYHKAIYKRLDRDDKENSPYEIYRNIENESEKMKFIKIITANEDYDPMKDKIPYEIFPEAQSNMIKKIQSFIMNNQKYKKVFALNEKNVLVSYNYKTAREMANIYLNYIDMVILIKYSHVMIIPKNSEDGKQIYEFLRKKEPYWNISQNGVIHSYGKKTGFDFKNENFISKLIKLTEQEV